MSLLLLFAGAGVAPTRAARISILVAQVQASSGPDRYLSRVLFARPVRLRVVFKTRSGVLCRRIEEPAWYE